MILYDLICGRDHVFEAWFRNGIVFDAQQAAGDITCPVCGSSEIFKAQRGTKHAAPDLSEAGEEQLARDLIQALERLCRSMDVNADEYDDEESEKIRRAKAEQRSIRRDVAHSDRHALRDEGIEVIRIPWIRRRHNS